MYTISFSRVNSLAMAFRISIVNLVPKGYLSNYQILKLNNPITQTTADEGFTLLPNKYQTFSTLKFPIWDKIMTLSSFSKFPV
jgi:hypothetical protein